MLIPKPANVRWGHGEFLLDATTTIAAPDRLRPIAAWLGAGIATATGDRRVEGPGATRHRIELSLSGDVAAEHYRLDVTPLAVRVEGGDAAGVFYGVQTLRQLLPPQLLRAAPIDSGPWPIPVVQISDGPRFAWRGLLLDVARRFLPKREVMRLIDLMALHKLNVLHLHLTDDQGWRVEIRRYPRLTEIGSWRTSSPVGAARHRRYDGRPHGGYYTQDDLREIVAYAAARHVTVVPEIDVPGHSQAAIAAYPELGNGDTPLAVCTDWGIQTHILNAESSTVDFFCNVLDEIVDLFPSTYICIGGDECPKDEWRTSARVQQRMRELELSNEDELQSWFIRRMAAHLGARGRRLCGWDEIIEGGLAPGATVLSWRGTQGAVAAARGGHTTVTSPRTQVYLDFRQSDRDDEPIPIGSVIALADVYAFQPVPDGLTQDEAIHVIGSSAHVWTEHIDDTRLLDYMTFPRLTAFAEAVWCDGRRDFGDFRRRLDHHEKRLDALGVEYRPATGPHPWQTRPDAPGLPEDRAELEARYAAETANLVVD